MSNNIIGEALSGVEKFIATAAPNLEQTLVQDAKNALTALENAVAPVAEAAADEVVTLALTKVPGGQVVGDISVAFINTVIGKLAALLPKALPELSAGASA